MTSISSMAIPRLFRVILPINDIDKAAEFYAEVLGIPGERVWSNRHYFDCGGVILACLEPQRERDAGGFTPNPQHIYFAVADIDAIHERAKRAGCQWLQESVEQQHWGERAFFAKDPFGNPLCFVDNATLYTTASSPDTP